jgi:hypothetical protein
LAEKIYPTRHTTVGAVMDAGLGIFAFCLDCDFGQEVDLARYARELGRDQSVIPVHLVPKLHCPKCESKNVGTVLIHPDRERPIPHLEHVKARWRAPFSDNQGPPQKEAKWKTQTRRGSQGTSE